MKVIVFGGSGFLGSHVADELTERGHEVIIFDKKRSPYLQGNLKMIVGDILEADVAGDELVVHRIATTAEMAEEHPKADVEVVEGEIVE